MVLAQGDYQYIAACGADPDVLELANVLSGTSVGRSSENSIGIVDLTGIQTNIGSNLAG